MLNLRYEGTDTAIMTPEPDDGDFAAAFGARFRREYGFELEGRDLVVDDVRVRGVGKTELLRRVRVDGSGDGEEEDALPPRDAVSDVYFEGVARDAGVSHRSTPSRRRRRGTRGDHERHGNVCGGTGVRRRTHRVR